MERQEVISKLKNRDFSKDVIREALLLRNEGQSTLFALARECRHTAFPHDNVQVRSVIETSNICRQGCRYCAIGGKAQQRNYTLESDVIVGLLEHLYKNGRRVVLLQSGENANKQFIKETANALSKAKQIHPDYWFILCMGSLSRDQYQQLKDAGADAYILKFETSNPKLFSYCRPKDKLEDRLAHIYTLFEIGFEIGSGNIVGLPSQTMDDLVDDLQLVSSLPLSMNSTTIFSPAEDSYFEHEPAGDANLTLNYMALMRIMNPSRLMPTTSSLRKLIPDGQYLGLMAGANTITVHDGTPEEYQKYFPIYSAKRSRPQADEFKKILDRAGLFTDNIL